MKLSRLFLAAALILSMASGCGSGEAPKQGDTVLATTYPMYYLTSRLLERTEGISAELMISDSVSCLHDYTLTTAQMRKIDRADLIVMNGGGLEDFMTSALSGVPEENIIAAGDDCGYALYGQDPHCWLDPGCYLYMSNQTALALEKRFPKDYKQINYNQAQLTAELAALGDELTAELADLSTRQMITFHDGFSWFAEAFDLEILAAIEEEEGATVSAREIREICDLIEAHQIPAIFVEKNGSTNAAEVIARETGVKIYTLNTMIDGQTDYFTAMRENVQAVKEALS